MSIYSFTLNSVVWRYYAHNFFRHLAFFSAVLVPFFTEWGHISLLQVQFLQSWFMMWIFLLEVPTGAVADFVGRKYSMALGAFSTVIAALIYGSVPDFGVFLLAEFFFALGMALTSGADEAFLYDSLALEGKTSESTRIFGRAHSVTLFGIMVGAGAGGFIASRFGLNATMLFTAIPLFLSAIIALTLKEPVVKKKISESRRYVEIVKTGFLYFYRHKKLRLLALDAVLVSVAGYFVIWLYQPVLQKLSIPIAYFGLGHMLLTGVEILIAGNFDRLTSIVGGAKRFFRYSSLLIALSFFGVALFPSVATVAVFIAVGGGLGMTRLPLMSAFMNIHIESGERATVISSISMFRRFTLTLVNPIVGALATFSLPVALVFVGLFPLGIFLFSPITEEMLENQKT